ncbi:MAG TPA: NAD(+)/NADH kinase [Terracidiphilus sp.]|nr:NAD(+)/NADH kinase [Terracidiphilus sp.]
MSRVAIISKPNKDELAVLLPELVEWLKRKGYEPLLDKESGAYCNTAPAIERDEMPALEPALVIVLGGDGTLLAAARVFAPTGTPILGVNLGFLGFLTEIRLAELYPTLEGWCASCHTLDARAMLHAELWREGQLISSFEALNEVVISKGDIARMGNFSVELDETAVASFRADGVIVSTPTGSTAYTLAANGPILTPKVDALVVTPICPHLLTLRPIVVPGSGALCVRVEAVPALGLLTVDGQRAIDLHPGDEVRCRRSENTVNLIRMRESGFFEALRSKLSWGEQ